MRGTLVNVGADLVGSGIGLAIGDRLSERFQRIITTGLGLSTLPLAAARLSLGW